MIRSIDQKLTCAICKKQVDLEVKQPSKKVHDRYVNCPANWFDAKGYRVIVASIDRLGNN